MFIAGDFLGNVGARDMELNWVHWRVRFGLKLDLVDSEQKYVFLNIFFTCAMVGAWGLMEWVVGGVDGSCASFRVIICSER